jgi:hypothetical protein
MLNLDEEIIQAFSTKHRRVNICFDIKETDDTPWFGVIPISRSLTSNGLFSNFQINWSDRKLFLRHRREWRCPSVSFFPVAIGMHMNRDHRLVQCSLMITSPFILGPRPFRPMKNFSFSPTDYHCEVWREFSSFVCPGGGNFLILGHSQRTAVCHLQRLLDFF